MMAALSESGRVGVTAVENSGAGAQALFDRAVATLEAEATAGDPGSV